MEDDSRIFSRIGLREVAGPAEQTGAAKRIIEVFTSLSDWDYVAIAVIFSCHPLAVLIRSVVDETERFTFIDIGRSIDSNRILEVTCCTFWTRSCIEWFP